MRRFAPFSVYEPDVRTFLKRWTREGPRRHFALGIGHRAETLRRLAEVLRIECAVIGKEAAR